MKDKKFETTREIYEALLEGKKVTWYLLKTTGSYVYLNERGRLVTSQGVMADYSFYSPKDWEIFEDETK